MFACDGLESDEKLGKSGLHVGQIKLVISVAGSYHTNIPSDTCLFYGKLDGRGNFPKSMI